jgi:CheY-like chemotaxis protein
MIMIFVEEAFFGATSSSFAPPAGIKEQPIILAAGGSNAPSNVEDQSVGVISSSSNWIRISPNDPPEEHQNDNILAVALSQRDRAAASEMPTDGLQHSFAAEKTTQRVIESFSGAGEVLLGSSREPSPRLGGLALRFLLVDDSPMNRKMMKRLLEARGHSVAEAEDGLECLKVINMAVAASAVSATEVTPAIVPDVILMDNNMPNMNGMEATQILRSEGYKGIIFGEPLQF